MAEYLPPVVQKLELDASDYTKGYDKAEARMGEFGKTSDKVTEKVKKGQKEQGEAVSDFQRLLGSKLQDGETGLQTLQREMDKTRTKVTDLRKEAAKTGNEGLFGDLKKAESDLKGLASIAETLGADVANAAKGGAEAGTSFGEQFAASMEATPVGPILTAILVGAVIAATPAMAAIINTAVLTGVGLGGFAIGFKEAIKDPRVHSTLDQLKSEISSTFTKATSGFIGPVNAGLAFLSATFARAEPGLKSTFDVLAQAAKPLIEGFGGFIEDALPGLESGLKAAEPLLVELADMLPEVGKHLGNMFRSMGEGAPGASLLLRGLINDVDGLLDAIGWITKTGSDMYIWWEGKLADAMTFLGTAAEVAATKFGWVPVVGDKTKALASGLLDAGEKMHAIVDAARDTGSATGYAGGEMADYARSTERAVEQLQALVDATNTWISAAQGSDDALLHMNSAISDFNEGITKGKKNWDEQTRAGQKNVGLLNAENEAITARFDKLASLHPLSQTQLKDEIALEQKLYDNAKAAGASDSELSTLKDTISKLKTELEKLNGTTATYTVKSVTTDIHYSKIVRPGTDIASAQAQGGVVKAAQGLVAGILPPSSPGTFVFAGEPQTHGEVMTPLAGISPQRAMGLSQVVGDAYGFDVAPRGRMAAFAGGGRGDGQTVIPTVVVQLGGKQMAVVHGGLMQYSQRFKRRTGTTGLT